MITLSTFQTYLALIVNILVLFLSLMGEAIPGIYRLLF